MKPRNWQQACSIALLPLLSGYASAAGFKVSEYSAAAMGAANSAGAAHAKDASTVFSNPAGMAQLSGPQITGSLSFISLDVEFENRGSTDALGNPIEGSSGGNASPLLEVPAAFWSAPINDKWFMGFGVTVPFGLTTDYDSDFIGRYASLKSELLSVDFNPSVAYQINDNWSVGFGLSLRYADVELTNAVDYGAVCLRFVDPASCGQLGLLPQAADGKAELTGDDWGYGYNVGVLYHGEQLSLGAHYRSKVDFELEGDGKFNNPAVVDQVLVANSGAFVDTEIKADLTLPETLSLSATYDINSQWTVMADYLFTAWSRFDALVVNFANPAQPAYAEPEDWEDVSRYSIGTEYRYSDQLTLRTGIAYDESPVPAENSRPRVPDTDRIFLAAGFSWQSGNNWVVDAAYNFVMPDDSDIDKAGNYGETLRGSYEDSKIHILTLGVSYKFN